MENKYKGFMGIVGMCGSGRIPHHPLFEFSNSCSVEANTNIHLEADFKSLEESMVDIECCSLCACDKPTIHINTVSKDIETRLKSLLEEEGYKVHYTDLIPEDKVIILDSLPAHLLDSSSIEIAFRDFLSEEINREAEVDETFFKDKPKKKKYVKGGLKVKPWERQGF